MRGKSQLLNALPFPVEVTLKRFGENLRAARIRRGLTLQSVAEKVGVNRWVIMDAERGKPSTGIAIYLSLLWTYDLLDDFARLADPASDKIGMALMSAQERKRVRQTEALDDDF
jgi:transcriptional regulator with XRE-family HTH domain